MKREGERKGRERERILHLFPEFFYLQGRAGPLRRRPPYSVFRQMRNIPRQHQLDCRKQLKEEWGSVERKEPGQRGATDVLKWPQMRDWNEMLAAWKG